MESLTSTFFCVAILLLGAATGTNLNSAEEGRCLAWMVRRVAGVDIPNLPTPINSDHPRQGKRGPVGMKGEPGIAGPPGTCGCDVDELASLRAENEELAENLAQMNTEMADIETRLLALENRDETPTQETTTQIEILAVAMECSFSVRHNPGHFPYTVTAIKCPYGCQSSGNIWGTGIYTDDSRICKSAIHDGKITSAGGVTFIKKLPGRSSYALSTANGITSNRYGSWDASYKFCTRMEC